MGYLLLVTVIWSFSFSLIGEYLVRDVDNWFAVVARICLALLVFLPFVRFKLFTIRQKVMLMGVGASQLGIMYIFYYNAFSYISVPELLLFTIFTPIYITLLYDLLQRHRLRITYLLTTILAVIGAAIIRYDHISADFVIGFLMVQGANITFAIGQVGYKRIMELYALPQRNAFAWVYIGAATISIICWATFGDKKRLPTTDVQWWIIIWLGVVASGLCYFLWNYGATKVDSGTLAIMNNVVIPVGIVVNVVLWHQSIEWSRFLTGSLVILLSLIVHQIWCRRK